jgi:hypothetical protein
MRMIRCQKGHYFDEEKHASCPYCGVNIDINIPVTNPMPNLNRQEDNGTMVLNETPHRQNDMIEGQRTVGIYLKDQGIDPVVGWLVCAEGAERGRDYRIRSERNFVGRSEKMDICIRGDETISREAHTIISYNPKKNTFRLYPGESKGIVHLNDEEVVAAMELKPYDRIELGKTILIFIPFCGEQFKW